MAYRAGARLGDLGQSTTSWWQIAGEVVTAVAKAAPSVVQAFQKSPSARAPIISPAITLGPPPVAVAPAAAAGTLGGMPTWGWMALGGGALLLVVLTTTMSRPIYVTRR